MLQNPAVQQVLASAGLFIFVWFVVGRLVFKPYLKVLEDREAETTGKVSDAAASDKKSIELLKEVEAQLKSARLDGIKLRDAKVTEAKKKADEILTQAVEEAEKELVMVREKIAQLKSNALADASHEAQQIAEQLADKVLRGSSAQTVH